MPSPSVTFGMHVDMVVDYGSNNTSFLYHFIGVDTPIYCWSNSPGVIDIVDAGEIEVTSDL